MRGGWLFCHPTASYLYLMIVCVLDGGAAVLVILLTVKHTITGEGVQLLCGCHVDVWVYYAAMLL